jgi:hypothetical protein
MVKKIEELEVKLGQMLKVANQEKKFNENELYVSVQVEDENGENERCLLFTEIELSDMEKITFDFAFEKMVCGRIYKAVIDQKETNLIKMTNAIGENKIYRVSNSQIATSEERAKRNPEDLTKKSLITDLMD